MKCFYHPDQALHAPPTFLLRGQPVPSPEGPVRAELLTQGLAKAGLVLTAPVESDSPKLRKRLEQIHTPRYLTFLETIYARWQALPNAAEFVAPNIHPCGGGHHYPRHPIGQAGWHLHDMACPLSATSFQGALASAATNLAEVAKEEAEAITTDLDQREKADLDRAFGYEDKGRRPREYASALREMTDDQKRRAKRRVLDVVDRSLMDLVSVYRDAIALASRAPGQLVNEEIRPDVEEVVRTSTPELNLRRIAWVFEAREQMLEFNVPVALALESMMVALKVPEGSR